MWLKTSQWIWMIFVTGSTLGTIAAVSGVMWLEELQPTPEVAAASPGCPNQALYLILGAALIVVIIFGAVFFGRRNQS